MFPSTEIQSTTRRRRQPWQRFVLQAFAAGIAALLPCPVGAKESPAPPSSTDPVVATINSEPVTANEYRLIMERKTAEVFSLMKQQHNLDDHPGYWSESTGPDGPLAKLREMVRAELVRIKVYQGLAKEKGLLKETSFASFQADFERENARRSAAKSAGQVIYGPAQYQPGTYYYIVFGDLVYKLKQALAKDLESQISDSEIEKYYEANKASFGDKPLDDMRKRILALLSTRAAEKTLAAACASAKVAMNAPLLRPLVPRAD